MVPTRTKERAAGFAICACLNAARRNSSPEFPAVRKGNKSNDNAGLRVGWVCGSWSLRRVKPFAQDVLSIPALALSKSVVMGSDGHNPPLSCATFELFLALVAVHREQKARCSETTRCLKYLQELCCILRLFPSVRAQRGKLCRASSRSAGTHGCKRPPTNSVPHSPTGHESGIMNVQPVPQNL